MRERERERFLYGVAGWVRGVRLKEEKNILVWDTLC